MRLFAVLCVFAACNSDPGGMRIDAAPMPDAGPPSAVDLLFVVEGCCDVLEKQILATNLPVLINALHNAPSGAPDLHIAITTTNMGAGAFTNSVPGCAAPDMGRFVDTVRAATDPACQTNRLEAGQHFFVDGASRNYTGDLATAVSCVLQVGAGGCGFRQHFAAMRNALGDPANGLAAPAENAGFLRPHARLAVVLVGEAYDCSAPPDTLLFDPSQTSLSDPLGPLSSFRCIEFGVTCDGLVANDGRIPRTSGGPYQNCRSNDAYASIDPQHSLTPVTFFVDYLRRIDSDVVVAAIVAPDAPFFVHADPQMNLIGVVPSCTASNGLFGAPSARIHQLVSAFGAKGTTFSVCVDSDADTLQNIANLIMTP